MNTHLNPLVSAGRSSLVALLLGALVLGACGTKKGPDGDGDGPTDGPDPGTTDTDEPTQPPIVREAEAREVAWMVYMGLYAATVTSVRESAVNLLPNGEQPPVADDNWVSWNGSGGDLVDGWSFTPRVSTRYTLDGERFQAPRTIGASYTEETADQWLEDLAMEASGTLDIVAADGRTGTIILGNGKPDPLVVDVRVPDARHDVTELSGFVSVEVDGVRVEFELDEAQSLSLEPDLWSTTRYHAARLAFTLRLDSGTMTGTVESGQRTEMSVNVNGDDTTYVFDYYEDLPFLSDPYAGLDSGPAPDFTLSSLDGENVSLADTLGGVAVLAFTAHWCGPCEDVLLNADAIAQVYADSARVMAFAYDDGDGFARVEDQVDPLELGYPVLEGTAEVAASYELPVDATAMPAVFVIDPSGNISARMVGPVTYADMAEAVEAASSL